MFQFLCLLGSPSTVSESVKLKVGRAILTADRLKTPLPRNGLIEKGLIKIVLAFLACPRFDMAAKDRQEIAASLLNLSLCESDHPIKVTYCLTSSSNATVEVVTKKMVWWERILVSCSLTNRATEIKKPT